LQKIWQLFKNPNNFQLDLFFWAFRKGFLYLYGQNWPIVLIFWVTERNLLWLIIWPQNWPFRENWGQITFFINFFTFICLWLYITSKYSNFLTPTVWFDNFSGTLGLLLSIFYRKNNFVSAFIEVYEKE
jgi:hypothetical protein